MKLDEKELIRGLRQGNGKAFETLVDRYQKKLFAIAFGITLDSEESLEIVQDVFVSVYQNIGDFREDSGLFTWMRKITVNLCLNWKRRWLRRFKWSHHSFEENLSVLSKDFYNSYNSNYGDTLNTDLVVDTPESQYMEYESEKIIMDKIGQLPEKIRTVFVLQAFEKMSYQDIADTLNLNIGTVKSRLHYAKKFITQSMQL